MKSPFSAKEEPDVKKTLRPRTYLEILDSLNASVALDITRYVTADTKEFFMGVIKLDYPILTEDWKKNHEYIIEQLVRHDILRQIKVTVDHLISTHFNDKDELDRFINGITNSLTMSDRQVSLLRDNLRKYPVLIFIRLVEMVGAE